MGNDICSLIILQTNLPQEIISKIPQSIDLISCVFLCCFVFFGRLMGRKLKLLPEMAKELSSVKDRDSIFSDPTRNEWFENFFLCLQNCLLLSVFIFKYYSSNNDSFINSPEKTGLFILISTLTLGLFFFLKWILYNLTGNVFFHKSALKIWSNDYFSLLAYSGALLFLPVLIFFYIDSSYKLFYYLVVFVFFLIEIIIIYKLFVLFFRKFSRLLYLFLYLCTLELVPLFFLVKVLAYMFNIVEKGPLWQW